MVKKNDLPEDVSVLSLQQQEKIVFSIVEQGCARQLIEMVENGYKLTPVIFELLKWSGQKDLIVSLLNVKFDYEGDARWLFAFLKKLLGSKETANLIVRKYNSAESSKNCWKRLMNLLSPEQMEENGRWDELAKEGCWDVLARNKRFDEIINNPYGRYTSDAARLLVENGQTDRIVELKKFQWFTQIAGGEEILWQHKQFGILFESRDRLRRWTEAEVLRKLCSTPEGQKYLYDRREYEILLRHNCFEPLQQNDNWHILASYGCYQAVDWNRWLQYQQEKKWKTLKVFIFAAKAKQWQFLADNGQYWQLLKNRQFALCCKKLFAGKKAHPNADHRKGCVSLISDDEV